MDGYCHISNRSVEFRDIDAAGHVNNAVYLTYLETARIDYMRDVLGTHSLDELAVIVANLKVDFRSPARFGEALEIGSRVPRVGVKSLEMEHEIRAGDGRIVVEATSVLVSFDYGRGATAPVPEEWRRRIDAYEESPVTA